MLRIAVRWTCVVVVSMAVVGVVPSGAAAGDGEGATPRLCRAFSKIGQLDADFTEALATSSDWESVRDELARIVPKINRAWRAAVRNAPDEHEDDARLVGRVTKRLNKLILEADSLAAAGSAILADPEAIETGLAAARLDTFSRDECGVSINNEP